MQKDVEKMTTNTARHGAFGVGERFAKPKLPDSADVSHSLKPKQLCVCLLTSLLAQADADCCLKSCLDAPIRHLLCCGHGVVGLQKAAD